MKNIGISLAVSALGFGLGWFVGNTWLAGIPTFIIAFCIVFFLLTRRTMRKLEAVLKSAGEEGQKAQKAQHPKDAVRYIQSALEILENGLALSKEQFGLEALIHSQMGAMHYQLAGMSYQQKSVAEMQRQTSEVSKHTKEAKKRFQVAKSHLEVAAASAWVSKITRSWHAAGMLASLKCRDGHHEEALEIMSGMRGPGAPDSMYWALRSYIALKADNPMDALLFVEEGKSKNPSSEPLTKLAEAISNKKEVEMFNLFGMNWFMFFPEEMTPRVMMQLQQQGRVDSPPSNRAMRRAIKKKGM
ncbi:MAG: hypothetical protein VXZ96_14800 [Myxococcota bacterium]|nr:hypothetical protein [Myxococcota bacterium]